MNPALVGALAQLTATAVETLLEYLKQPPADAASAIAADEAALALMVQQQRIADALRARLGVPDASAGGKSVG